MSFTLELFENPQIHQILTKCAQLLKIDGRLVVVLLSKKGKHPKIIRWYERLHEKYPHTIDCRPIDLIEFLKQTPMKNFQSLQKEMWGLSVEIVRANNIDNV